MKKIICMCLLIWIIVPALPAVVLDPVLWYKNESVTNGLTLNETCQLWAVENGENPDRWFRTDSGYTNFYRQYYSDNPTKYEDHDWREATHSDIFIHEINYDRAPNSSLGYSTVNWHLGCCKDYTYNCGVKVLTGWTWTSDERPPGEVDFIGDPLDGYAPLAVNFTIYNFTAVNASGATWYWGDGQSETVTTSTKTHTYENPGIYSVSLHFWNISDVENTITKPNYVLASNASGLIVNLDVKHAITGALIQDSTVGIQNTSTGVWRNVTAPTGLVYFSSTDPGYLYPLTQGQSITLAANKSGFSDASSTFNIPYNNYLVQLFLMPNTVVNSTGNGTVVVNTIANKDGHSIPRISVSLDSGQMGITNSAGAVTLFNVSAGTRYAQIVDSQERFQDTSTSFDLSAGETKLVVVQMVYEGDDPVETPVSPTPTPTGTYDPDDPNSPVYGNYTTSEINQQGGAGVLGMLMQLIQLWPAIVIMAFMKFMRSAMS